MTEVQLSLVAIYSCDIQSTKSFYERLGLQFKLEQHGTGPEHFAATLAQAVFEIYPSGEGKEQGRVRLGFRVPNVDAVVEDLQCRGTRIVSAAKTTSWGRRAVVEDPDGNYVELVE